MADNIKNGRFSLYLRLLISIILFILIFKGVDFRKIGNLVLSIKIEIFLLSVFLIFVDRFVVVFRWNLLLKAKGCDVPFLRILCIDLASGFIGLFLPSSAGGDIVKGYGMAKYTSNVLDSVSSLLIDRIISTWVLLLLGVIGVFLSYSYNLSDYNIMLVTITIFSGFSIVLFFFSCEMVAKKINPSLFFLKRYKFLKKIEKLYSAIADYNNNKVLIVQVITLCLVVQLIRILIVYLFCIALNINVSFIYFIMFIPLIYVLMLIPVSIHGIGVQEVAYLFFFTKIGLDKSIILSIPILGYMAVVIASIPGGIIYAIIGVSNTSTSVRQPLQ